MSVTWLVTDTADSQHVVIYTERMWALLLCVFSTC